MRGQLRSKVIIAGAPQHIDAVARVLARESWLGLEVVGALSTHADDPTTRLGVPVIGSPQDVVECLRRDRVDAVVFAEGAVPSADEFRRLAWALEEQHAQMIVVPAMTDISRERISVRPVAGLPLMLVDLPRAVAAGRWLKRAFDVVGASVLLVLLSPVLLAGALSVKLYDRGSILFPQVRVGRGGREFACLKFRSMIPNAESMVDGMQRDGAGNEVLFKQVNDQRITPVGKFLRRFSVDELPQLINVLKGDMSLVGPRPPLPKEVATYDEDAMRRLRVRPGMTGLWQVSGRSDLSWEDTVRLDLYYVDNWSIVQDLLILARTANAVFVGRGAY